MRFGAINKDGKRLDVIIEGENVFALKGDFFGKKEKGDDQGTVDDVDFTYPVMPTKIICVGLNYKAHAAEFGLDLPDEPLIFMKPLTTLIGDKDDIVYPHHMSRRVDYEGELGVIIGKKCHGVKPEEAMDYVLGYTCVNDVTARDLQGRDKQFTRAKGFDTFCPVGPWIETDIDPNKVQVKTYLEGELKQNTNTDDMIFDVATIVSFISEVMTLYPGDLIATGTPSGIAKMKPGMEVRVEIENIGSLTNKVIEGHLPKIEFREKKKGLLKK